MKTHILIVNAALILFMQNSFAQNEKFLYKFENGIDSIGATIVEGTYIFIYDVDYTKKIKAYKEAVRKIDPNIPMIMPPSPPLKYQYFLGYEVPKGTDHSNFAPIDRRKLLERYSKVRDNHYILLPKQGDSILLRLRSFPVSIE